MQKKQEKTSKNFRIRIILIVIALCLTGIYIGFLIAGNELRECKGDLEESKGKLGERRLECDCPYCDFSISPSRHNNNTMIIHSSYNRTQDFYVYISENFISFTYSDLRVLNHSFDVTVNLEGNTTEFRIANYTCYGEIDDDDDDDCWRDDCWRNCSKKATGTIQWDGVWYR